MTFVLGSFRFCVSILLILHCAERIVLPPRVEEAHCFVLIIAIVSVLTLLA